MVVYKYFHIRVQALYLTVVLNREPSPLKTQHYLADYNLLKSKRFAFIMVFVALPYLLETFHKIGSSTQHELEIIPVNNDPRDTRRRRHTICNSVL